MAETARSAGKALLRTSLEMWYHVRSTSVGTCCRCDNRSQNKLLASHLILPAQRPASAVVPLAAASPHLWLSGPPHYSLQMRFLDMTLLAHCHYITSSFFARQANWSDARRLRFPEDLFKESNEWIRRQLRCPDLSVSLIRHRLEPIYNQQAGRRHERWSKSKEHAQIPGSH